MSLSPEVMAVAERQAAEDRAILARLRASGKVQRVGPANELTRDIEARAFPRRQVNLAIRPKRKKGKR